MKADPSVHLFDNRPTSDRRYLIVNADDLGYSAGVNRGILEAHRDGIVSSASVTPAPRKKVRRGMCFLVINIRLSPLDVPYRAAC